MYHAQRAKMTGVDLAEGILAAESCAGGCNVDGAGGSASWEERDVPLGGKGGRASWEARVGGWGRGAEAVDARLAVALDAGWSSLAFRIIPGKYSLWVEHRGRWEGGGGGEGCASLLIVVERFCWGSDDTTRLTSAPLNM